MTNKQTVIPNTCENCGILYHYKLSLTTPEEKTRYCIRCIKFNRKNAKKAKYQSHYTSDQHLMKWTKASIHAHKFKDHKIHFTPEELFNKAKNNPSCQLCGIPLFFDGVGLPNYRIRQRATFDRIKNTEYYTIEEIGIICARCNTSKGAKSFDEFKINAIKLVEYIRQADPLFLKKTP